MKNNSGSQRQVRYGAGEPARTAGPAAAGAAPARRDRTLQRLRSSWQRRMGATGLLLAVIAVTVAVAG